MTDRERDEIEQVQWKPRIWALWCPFRKDGFPVAEQQAEIERLKAALSQTGERWRLEYERAEKAQAEIERLKVRPCQHCGHAPDPVITRSVAVDQSGCPVAATCTLLGCMNWELQLEIERLKAATSRLEDAAFHFQTCRTCAEDGEDSCENGRKFAAYLRGESVDGD